MRSAVNWNSSNNEIYKVFWDQNVRQFWVDEEIPVSEDKQVWNSGEISELEKDTYEKVLASLTLLDTEQGGLGMPSITLASEDLHQKAIFSFMGMMEQMHAKSYSTIFSTLSSESRISELFDWVENNYLMQTKVKKIIEYYQDSSDEASFYRALSASVLLETFLFYSGFYYPLYFAGQGKLIRSAEIISLIIRDESIHGQFTGLIAIKELEKFDEATKKQLRADTVYLMQVLHEYEEEYTHMLYGELGLADDVMRYVEYNADKALMNLGIDPYFNVDESQINPIILNGISTNTKNHDFFSTKGNGYIKTTNVVPIDDSVFEV